MRNIWYLLKVIFVYVLLGILDYSFGSFLFGMLVEDYNLKKVALFICLIVFNPIITYFLVKYKKKAKAKNKDIQEDIEEIVVE